MKINITANERDPSSLNVKEKQKKSKSCFEPIKVLNFSFADWN